MRRFARAVVAVVALTCLARSASAADPTPLLTPQTIGDQLIFYYDARADFTTFITIRNGSDSELAVSVLFYGPTFSTPFSKAVTLAAGALTILDVGSLRGSGLPAQPGAAFAAAVDLSSRPIATGALSGSFTVANLRTGSAWGAPGAARSAVDKNDDLSPKGTIVDGNTAKFSPIRNAALVLPAYYDPASLAPVADGGNQLIFVNFEDHYDSTYGAAIGSTTWTVAATRANGAGVGSTIFTSNGVTVSDLASVAGAGVNGAAGSLMLLTEADDPVLSRLVYFTESLGSFGTGYLLPPPQ